MLLLEYNTHISLLLRLLKFNGVTGCEVHKWNVVPSCCILHSPLHSNLAYRCCIVGRYVIVVHLVRKVCSCSSCMVEAASIACSYHM
jgi:hypothetical protein